jgi:sulfur-oxidizing protein SoxZ
MAGPLINIPASVKRGEVFEIKTLIRHPMETGYRRGISGEVMPRDIIGSFSCTYNGEEILRAELFPAVAANPFISFFALATETGELAFVWTDEAGQRQTATATITVA